MADAGARRIKHLLSTSTPTLRKRAAAARQTMSQLVSRPPAGSQVSTSSISDLQAYYRHLARQIQATHTSSRKAKRAVLKALGRLDSGLSTLVAAIQVSKNTDAKPKFDLAHKRINRANHDLSRAVKRLA